MFLLRPLLVCILLSSVAVAQGVPASDAQSDPISIGIVLDDSADSRYEPAVREAVKTIVSYLRDGDEYAILAATDRVTVAQEITDDPALAIDAVRKVHGHRRSIVFDGVLSAIEYMKENASNERRALLVLSSGVDKGSRNGISQVLAAAREAALPIYTVAVATRNWKANANLQQLANVSGGTAFFPAKTNEVDDVSQAIAARLTGGAATPRDRTKTLSAYSELLVRSIPVAEGGDTRTFPKGDNHRLQKLLVSRLLAKHVFPQVTDATSDLGLDASDVPKRPGAVELLGTIVSYREGSRLKRGTAGLLGSGAARLRVQFIFRDAATGKDLFTMNEEATGASGLLAGDNDDNRAQAMARLVEHVVRDIQKKR